MPGSYQDHRYIWLEPWCNECEAKDAWPSEGRTWCHKDAWGKCEECGRKPVLYKAVSDRTRRRLVKNGEVK